ncbi:hypothetical protein B0H11DRAFT_2026080, partial [Mycena galericulata]
MPNPKRPFQDITHRFVSPAPTPLARPRRKPKMPGGALGEKLRLRVIETTKSTTNAFPSSLPPSSPPFYSSSSRGLPLLDSEDQVAQEIHGSEEEEEEALRRHPDFGTMLPSDEDEDEDTENRAPATLSDPFGFFAVERKLKAAREVSPPQQEPVVLRASRYTDDKERDDGRVMPSTPHKPKIGKHVSPTADVFSPATPSESPSPVKGARSQDLLEEPGTSRELFPVQRKAEEDDGEDDDDDDDDDQLRKSKRQRQSSDASLPPRRSTRVHNKATAAPKDKAVSKPTKRARKAPTRTRAVKGKKKASENNDVDEDEQDVCRSNTTHYLHFWGFVQEKFAAERRARLEYFRKLDDYSFEKENVYV